MDASIRLQAEQLAADFAGQARTAQDLNDLMRLMMKSTLERMLNTELDFHLGRKKLAPSDPFPPSVETASDLPVENAPAAAEESASSARSGKKRSPNRRNGHSKKTVSGDMGELTLDTPRDRDGTCCWELGLPSNQAQPNRNSSPSISGACRASMKKSWPCTPKA